MSTPPPPQGGNPFAQPQGGYGQPQPQGGNPYGQPQPQGGYGYPQPQGGPQPSPYLNQGGGFPPGGPVPPPARNRPPIGKILRFAIPIVAIAIAIGGYFLSSGSDAEEAKVGDCVHINNPEGNADLKLVDCTSSEAQFKVAEKAKPNACDQNKYAEYQQTGRGKDLALCLTPLKPMP